MKITNSLTMNGNFETVEDVHNSGFLRTKMKVFALGQNANGSAFSLDSFTSAKKSLALIPVVAKFTDEADIYGEDGDLTGHNVMLVEKENETSFFHDTYPIGVVSNTSNFTIEEVNEGTELNPDIKQYIVADEVYLWKRYEATKKIEEWISKGISPKISMEIGSVEGKFSDDGYFQIEDFEFEAIAALGSEVTPCFKKAEITTYSKNEFKKELKELVFELNKTLNVNSQEGGSQMTEEKVEKLDESEAVELEVEFIEVDKDKAVETVQEEVESEVSEETENEKANKETVEDGAKESEADVETKVEQEVSEDVEHDNTEETDVDFEAKYIQLADSYVILQSDFDSMKSQTDELKSYKRQREELDLKDKFSGKLSEDEFAQVFEELKDIELDKVEEKIFALIGKKNFSIQPEVKDKKEKITIVKPKEISDNPYGSIFD